MLIDMGVSQLQHVAKDNTDRNRTSPFAFTGNKFEFRAVGSSAPVNYPTSVLNAAVVSGLNQLNTRLAAKVKGGSLSAEDTLAVLREVVVETKKIRFEGNGYSQEWREEAARRGLSNLTNTPSALAVFRDKSKMAFMVESGILTLEDVEARATVQIERYIKQRLIEVNCAVEMVQSGILPASMEYLGELVDLAKGAEALGIPSPAKKLANEVGATTNRVEAGLTKLILALDKASTDEATEHHNLFKTADLIAGDLLPKLEEMREAVDLLEVQVAGKRWPYPKYQDMLFGIE